MNTNSETWKPIVGYEDLYEVSNQGRVRSVDHIVNGKRGPHICRGRVLKPYPSCWGYLMVNTSAKYGHKHLIIHRIVAQAFIPNPDSLPCVNHKDENKLNNCADNLEWCTLQYNNNYGTRVKRMAQTQGRAVNQYDMEMNFVASYFAAHEAGRQTGISSANILKCCHGERNYAGGYKWRFAK